MYCPSLPLFPLWYQRVLRFRPGAGFLGEIAWPVPDREIMRMDFSMREEVVASNACPVGQGQAESMRQVTYYFQSVPAGRWVGTDDLEFRADEPLSGDEVAQTLFMLSGGVTGQACGHVGDFCMEYDASRPAMLRLHAPSDGRCRRVPRIYHRT